MSGVRSPTCRVGAAVMGWQWGQNLHWGSGQFGLVSHRPTTVLLRLANYWASEAGQLLGFWGWPTTGLLRLANYWASGAGQLLGFWGWPTTGLLGQANYWASGAGQLLGFWGWPTTGLLRLANYWASGAGQLLGFWGWFHWARLLHGKHAINYCPLLFYFMHWIKHWTF